MINQTPDYLTANSIIATLLKRKQIEKTLAFQAKLLSNVHDALTATDENFNITYWNKGSEEIFGWTAQEALGKSIFDLFGKNQDAINQILIKGNYEGEMYFRRKDETYILAEIRAKAIRSPEGQFKGVMTSSRDITERKQAEKALQESEKKFRTLVDQAAQMLFLHDDEGHIIDVNQKTVAQLGYTREELLQMHVFDLDPDADQRDDKNWLWKNWPTGGEAITFETRHRRKDGSIYPAEVTASKIILNNTTYVLSLVHDITERKQFEKALIDNEIKFRDLAETLQLTDRRKDKFLAILSHEIRNPLAAMRMALSLFEQDSLDGEQAKKAKEILNRQVTHLSSLIDDLLDIPRITQNKIVLQKKQLELNELVTKTVKSFQFLFQEKGIQLEIKLAPTCLYVEADEIRLTQVVENLLHNAAKFTANNGITQVTIFKDNLQQNAIIQVKDSGIGMEPEMLSHIFEPFIQADTSLDRSASGLGLGLALVKDLVELHDGKVTAHSEGLGKGSEFIVSLPLVSTVQAEQVAIETDRILPPNTQRRRRVLIIDDNRDIAEILSCLLEKEGHEVMVAYNGTQGIANARQFRPEVLICDIGLPGLDGYQVAQTFRTDEELKDVIRISLTGYTQPEELQRAQEAGFQYQLSKPVDLETLIQALNQIEPATSASSNSLFVAHNSAAK